MDSQYNTAQGTFRSNTSLLTFSAPLLTSITGSGRCFENASKMTTFYAPNLAGSLASTSFSGCSALNSFTAGPITSLEVSCFSGCSSLTSLTFNDVISVGATTFNNCTGLTDLTINNATSIGSQTFNNCTNINIISLRSLTICGGSTANNNVFSGIKIGCNITVPIALQTINSGAPDGDLVYASGTRGATIIYV
ncbi:leucine-rich repeat protein [Flavobacterium ginsenosidimutans]|uniref:Leucine-rich repeat protein n=1 Tax=Flavobacterium ginsenosidimutans TaxID=687844 RepID=A0ABZ2QJJ2_9FLAO